MDVSEQYIEMCSKAEEIQALKSLSNLNNGDFYERFNEKGLRIYQIGFSNEGYGQKIIWLPRQDQLQEMAGDDILLIVSFSNFCIYGYSKLMFELKGKKYGYCNHVAYKSFDQLWLSFVMQKKYNKAWDFETKEWIKYDR